MADDFEVQPTEEDAFNFIVRMLRQEGEARYSDYGYGLYLPKVMRSYIAQHERDSGSRDDRDLEAISPAFYAAAWSLCRRGILRPGIRAWNKQSTTDGCSNGYSITPFGSQWISESDSNDYVPSEPGRFAAILNSYGPKFGPGYQERAQEAMRCYGAHAYFACCAMCGAAAESIVLAIAIARTNDEKQVISDYSSKGGRGRIENLFLGQQPKGVQDEFRGCSSLLKYWRDSAAHGQALGISDTEAYTSLALLLRLSQLAFDRWDDLTGKP